MSGSVPAGRQNRGTEHFGLHLRRFDLLQIHFHEQGFGICVGLEEFRRQRIVARPEHVNRTEQVDGIVLAVYFPERVQRAVGAHTDAEQQTAQQQAQTGGGQRDTTCRSAIDSIQWTWLSMRPSGCSSKPRYAGGRESIA